MATVFLDGPNNSTLFTTCCEVAISRQENCPRCGQDVDPKTDSMRWQIAYEPIKAGRRWYGNWFPNHGEGQKR